MDARPPFNLPGKSESWGRAVDATLNLMISASAQQGQFLSSSNRSLASTISTLSGRIKRIQETSSVVSNTQFLNPIEVVPAWFDSWYVTAPTWAEYVSISRTNIKSPGKSGGSGNPAEVMIFHSIGSQPTTGSEEYSWVGYIYSTGPSPTFNLGVTLALDDSRRVYSRPQASIYADTTSATMTTQSFYQWF